MTNHAVNIDLCKRLIKATMAWYPDDTGKPSIKFDGCDTEWAFSSAEARDAEYRRLIIGSAIME